MNQPRRKTDIIVGVISKKGNDLAKLIANSIEQIFESSHYSVITFWETNDDQFDELIEKCSIVIIDKSLGHDLRGTDGIDLLERVAAQHPHKKFMVMSSIFDVEQISRLTAARFKLHKPMQMNVLKDTVEHCIKEIEIQHEIDTKLWKIIEG